MAVFLPRAETMDSSLAVTLSDWDAHCLRPNGATEAIFAERLSNQSVSFPGTEVVPLGGQKEHLQPHEHTTEANKHLKLLLVRLPFPLQIQLGETPFLCIQIFMTLIARC